MYSWIKEVKEASLVGNANSVKAMVWPAGMSSDFTQFWFTSRYKQSRKWMNTVK